MAREMNSGQGTDQWQCCSSGKVTVGLVSHRPYVTDIHMWDEWPKEWR